MIKPVATVDVSPNLPPSLERLRELAYNLHWSWDHEAMALLRRLDRDLWEETEHNPVWQLGLIGQEALEAAAHDEAFMAHLDRVCSRFDAYMSNEARTWYRRQYGEFDQPYIAYFSMEYGLTECLRNYSGGLGVLSGDHLKSASDLGLPLVGIGLLYEEGYFHQYLNADGYQQQSYPINDYSNLPVQQVHNADGTPLIVEVPIAEVMAKVCVWKVQVGRVPLYLLDTNHTDNPDDVRDLTDRLYGGDKRTRIRQEILLGIGGMRLLEALNIRPMVCHMNEGHSAFLALERVRVMMQENPGLDFWEAADICAAGNLFTTHTPVPAGLERFGYDLIDEHFPYLWEALGLTREEFHDLGRENMGGFDLFSMPVLALKLCHATNAVSQLHGAVSRTMWQWVYPEVPEHEIPLGAITNGIHIESWLSGEMTGLYDRYLDPAWRDEPDNAAIWADVERIPDAELWRTHERRRERLVSLARRKLRAQLQARAATQAEIEGAREVLNPDALTIGFARRFATYKRATLILRDKERLARLVNDPDRPVQFIFAGKAHPHDHPGKELIKEIVKTAELPEFRHSMVFLENYDMSVARYMTQGVDVWLNTPRRPKEASGTSGMKVIYNGGLNASILDGWWAEAYDPSLGWAIGSGEEYDQEEWDLQDYIEAQALYNLLEDDLIPSFYTRGRDGLPRDWIGRVKSSVKKLAPFFNTYRMVREYTEEYYMPSHARFQALVQPDIARGKAFADWQNTVRAQWAKVAIVNVEVKPEQIKVNEDLNVQAWVNLGALKPEDVEVQVYYGPLDSRGQIVAGEALDMQYCGPDGNGRKNVHEFSTSLAYANTGRRGLSVRVLPHHEDLADPIHTGLITWANK
ncbi:alpha-glucan family phosphorylase [Aggregatilinea lenta]|uniref:alpha-glucan family phosphorylase n=1 Tax=Aggregatilinea lenta TaxID=913108 RepID=UPI00157C4DE3|nr:alpha-glucan family phosphorylase [Aggregatilinea lenta]